MEHQTRGGHRLSIGRVPRQRIDSFAVELPAPEPPVHTVEVWGDISEEVPDYGDPGYQEKLAHYWLELGKRHVDLIAPAVKLPADVDLGELAELREIGLTVRSESDGVADFLRYVVADEDTREIVGLVLYQSTVTDRGMAEASARYNVTWNGQRLSALVTLGKSPGFYGPEFEARRAAQFANKEWEAFCELPGQEQSNIVAFYRLNASLAWLQAKEGK